MHLLILHIKSLQGGKILCNSIMKRNEDAGIRDEDRETRLSRIFNLK